MLILLCVSISLTTQKQATFFIFLYSTLLSLSTLYVKFHFMLYVKNEMAELECCHEQCFVILTDAQGGIKRNG